MVLTDDEPGVGAGVPRDFTDPRLYEGRPIRTTATGVVYAIAGTPLFVAIGVADGVMYVRMSTHKSGLPLTSWSAMEHTL